MNYNRTKCKKSRWKTKKIKKGYEIVSKIGYV